jgi:hypothetical protein
VRTEQDEDVKGYLLHKDNRQEILKSLRITTLTTSREPLGFLENFVFS